MFVLFKNKKNMKFIIGKDKFPLIEVKENVYLHIFPITKYQFERFMWNVSPESIDYKKILEVSPRISPFGLTKKKLSNLFITQISFEEAIQYAQWMNGKIPKFDFILEFEKKFWKLDFSKMRDLLKVYYDDIDIRFWKILDSLEKIEINNIRKLFEALEGGEICYNDLFESNISIKKYGAKNTYELTGDEPQKIRWYHSFRILKEKEEN